MKIHASLRSASIPLEICINENRHLLGSAEAAYRGGASRIELCRAMEVDGLTPSPEAVRRVRSVLTNSVALMVMIRPRAGDFDYSEAEIQTMLKQIEAAARSGADGVVFGVVRRGRVCEEALKRLVAAAKSFNLTITFHRAFDALSESTATISLLAEAGVNRILTAGYPWGSAALWEERCRRWSQMLLPAAASGIEIILAGGMAADNAVRVLRELPVISTVVSLHAYSSVLEGEATDEQKVKELAAALERFVAAV